jgi:predicted RecB family nuclease
VEETQRETKITRHFTRLNKIEARRVKHELHDDEKRQMGEKLAEKFQETALADERQKETAKTLKAEVERLENECASLASDLRAGYIYREMNCDLLADFIGGLVQVIHPETGEVIDTRELTEKERQLEFSN